MPERSKRKNKNKNKRKNKNNRVENTNNNCEVIEKESEESFSAQLGNDVSEGNNKNLLFKNPLNEDENISELVRSDVSTSDDVNNNSSVVAVETLQLPVQNFGKVEDQITAQQECDVYIVESPEQSFKSKPKLNNTNKSKSLDNEDAPKIIDITEDVASQSEEDSTLAVVDTSNILVSDVDSDIEWEKTEEVGVPTLKDVAIETLSVSTDPLNVAQCQQINISLSPDVETSLRSYLRTLDLSTHPESSVEIKAEIEQIINREIRHRLRKKGLADDFGVQRLGPPRKLDVIDEEGSSESSKSSRRQSYLSDKKSDNEDLEDDVFEDKNKIQEKMARKTETTIHKRTFGRLVPQQCVLVGAKIKEPEVTEAGGNWTMQTLEKMTGAEVVYLTDSSSSTSSLHEYGDETDDGMETDVSVRMITPTIEVTDTEHFLKNSFISSEKNESPKGQETKRNEHIIFIDYKKDNDKKDQNQASSVQNPHEIIVLSTDNIKTNLYVKDVEPPQQENGRNAEVSSNISNLSKEENTSKTNDKYDLEIKVLKCELNDAINNLIKEVSDSELQENSNETFVRQDSSSSVCSSQCTAKYNPTSSSLNDVSNILHDETGETNQSNTDNNDSGSMGSHVKDVFEHVAGTTIAVKNEIDVVTKMPSHLRDLCVKRIASFPYGDKILEELASVSKRIQHITGVFTSDHVTSAIDDNKKDISKKNCLPYYPLPDGSPIERVILPTKTNGTVPPPVQPRQSSLKKKSREEEVWSGIPTKSEPVYVCLSPSQKMLMEKTNTVIDSEEASELIDMHKTYVERRGHNDQYTTIKQAVEKSNDDSPIVPFKSQTGSRLLALIRDPTVTKNIDVVKKHSSLDQLEKKFAKSLTTSTQNQNMIDLSHNNNKIKPVPPPRPKKLASSIDESDESDFTDSTMRSMKSERKFFHFSTGNLNKEIEDDISTIQNMHRNYTNTRDSISECPRRPSLPKDLCDQQMEYIRQKEKEVEAEIQRLESHRNTVPPSPQRIGPRAPLISETEVRNEHFKDSNNYFISKRRDFFASLSGTEKQGKYSPTVIDNKEKGKLSSVFSNSQEELQREKMYSEYVTQMAQREERKQHKVIKITNTPVAASSKISKSVPAINILDSKVNNRIEKEFISKARERWDKLGIKDPETEDERDGNTVYREPKVIEHKIKVIEGGQEKDVTNLPNHLQEFVSFTAKEKKQRTDSSETVMITPTFKARSTSPAVWRPGGGPLPAPAAPASPGAPPPPPPPVWTPGTSPLAGRKAYRPVRFEDTPPTRRKFGNSEQNGCTSGSESEGRGLRTSQSAPVTGLNTLGSNSRLPRAQNPTVTLLQKAREGQIPRGSSYIQEEARLPRDRPSPPRGDPVHALRREYASETEADRSEHERSRKMADAPKKVEGIGPITKEGMPVSLRSEVKDPSRWYKKMYDTIHKNKYDDDYVTIRYKSRRGQPPERVSSNKSQYAYFDPRSGYLSEPEGGLNRLTTGTWSDAYDSDVTTGPRRRTASVQEDRRMNETTTTYMQNNKYSTLASARASQEVNRSQPGRIENYMPGRSSVVDKEAKQWWDEVMDIFDGQNISSTTSLPQASPKERKDITSAILSKSNMARALKESGYESDSTLVFRRRDDAEGPLSPAERRAAYRDLQAGGEPPLRGFRSPAPHRQESPRRYVESDVNIHYRCPVRHDPLPLVPEKELARQQAEHMKRLYREQRRNKYLQELQDMQNRRHQDNFTPSQKNILPLNRYDEAERVIAKALYTFNGQTPRELSFRKGDVIHVRRQIDSNWYEGEIHGRIGLFPFNYVEIQKGDTVQAPKKPAVVEGRARAKFDFTAQTNLELPLKKGEVVVLTRRIDQNWWEGRNGTKTGIFPDSYVTILQEPSQNKPEAQLILKSEKPVASPAAHGLMNGSAKRSMGAHSYTPQQNSQALSNAPPATQPLPGYTSRQAPPNVTPSERGYGPPTGLGVDLNNSEPLYVDTNAEAVPYRAMYKYRPQNPDELELCEGDTVYVLEKCDDGWYVGSSQRTGRFGTFPGNYVERI